MTVKELIKALGQYPSDMEVGMSHMTCMDSLDIEVSAVDKVRIKEVYFNTNVNEYLLADDDAYDRDVDVENRVVLFASI